LVFFNDILIYSPSWQLHLEHLELVLQLLQQHQLFAKFSKCCFGLRQVDYLGHTISGAGITMETAKVIVVLNWQSPKTVKQLRAFLGLTGYYRKFIKGYASMAAPLTEMLKKDNFYWTSESTIAFEQLKAAITAAPVLILPDFTKPFILETDASGVGIGVVLS